MGAMSKTSEGSQPPGAVLSMLLMLYSGFVVPFGDMRPWLKWFSYINLVYYGFESLVINEFSGRSFPCALYVPDYPESTLEQKASKAVRSTPGSDFVLGDADMYETWGYRLSHLWRNLGIMMVLMFLYGAAFIICSELVSLQPSRGEILLCREKDTASRIPPSDEESDSSALVPRQGLDQVREKSEVYVAVHMAESDAATFVWKTLTYTIKVGKTEKKTLEDMEGSLMPQTMTALVGASGAGKTTLLYVLADRTTVGVVDGERHIATQLNGLYLDKPKNYHPTSSDDYLDPARGSPPGEITKHPSWSWISRFGTWRLEFFGKSRLPCFQRTSEPVEIIDVVITHFPATSGPFGGEVMSGILTIKAKVQETMIETYRMLDDTTTPQPPRLKARYGLVHSAGSESEPTSIPNDRMIGELHPDHWSLPLYDGDIVLCIFCLREQTRVQSRASECADYYLAVMPNGEPNRYKRVGLAMLSDAASSSSKERPLGAQKGEFRVLELI